jgi:hypothetical protein
VHEASDAVFRAAEARLAQFVGHAGTAIGPFVTVLMNEFHRGDKFLIFLMAGAG